MSIGTMRFNASKIIIQSWWSGKVQYNLLKGQWQILPSIWALLPVYQKFYKNITVIFGTVASFDVLMQKFYKVTQGNHEKVPSFATRWRAL